MPLLRRRRGRLERSRQQLGPLMTAGRGRSARGVCVIPEGEYRCGDCHLGRGIFREVRRPACGWHIRGAGGDIATRDQHFSARWVYSWKSDEFGLVVRAKARLVARGLGQREGIDFIDTFWRMVQ